MMVVGSGKRKEWKIKRKGRKMVRHSPTPSKLISLKYEYLEERCSTCQC